MNQPQFVEYLSQTQEVHLSVTRVKLIIVMNLITPKAAAKFQHWFN